MKKLLLLITISLFAGFAHGQIVIRKPNITSGMKIKTISQGLEITGASVKDTTGTGKSWDFSALKKVGKPDTSQVEVLNATGTPYASIFPQANYAWVVNDTSGKGYAYIKFTDTELEAHGFASAKDTSKYVDPMLIMKFPFNYGDRFTDKFVIQLKDTTQEQNRIVKYVASGSIRTPDKTYNNVALVKAVQELQVMTFKIITEDLTWYDENFQEVMSVNISYPFMPGGEFRYSASYNVASPSSVENNLQVAEAYAMFPNPADGQFIFLNNGTAKTLTISDALGRTLEQVNLTYGENSINTGNLVSGIYYVNVMQHSGKNVVQKLIVK